MAVNVVDALVSKLPVVLVGVDGVPNVPNPVDDGNPDADMYHIAIPG